MFSSFSIELSRQTTVAAISKRRIAFDHHHNTLVLCAEASKKHWEAGDVNVTSNMVSGVENDDDEACVLEKASQ